MMNELPTSSGFEELPSEDPLLGLQLGNFVLQEKIGEGGYGVVYRAEQIYLKQPFAIKLLHLSTRAAPEVIERFRREALAIAKLRHAHVVQLADFGMLPEERGFYLVMELLEGQSLADALEAQEPFSMERITSIIQQLCEVLHEAHTLGIFHRDLKPANIFLMPHRHGHDVIKLLDFGIASMLQEKATLTQTATVLGSPAYMSPEQSQGHASSLDGRSDLYSLGVVLFELLTGRMPFVADTLTGMLFQHAFEPPPSLSSARPDLVWPPQIEAFVAKALAKSPDDRPQDADAFSAECTAALQAEREQQEGRADPIAINAPASKQRVPASLPAQYSATQSTAPKKRRWGLVFAALLLLVAAGGYAVWEGQYNHNSVFSSGPPQATSTRPDVAAVKDPKGKSQPPHTNVTNAKKPRAALRPRAATADASAPGPQAPTRRQGLAPKQRRSVRHLRRRRHHARRLVTARTNRRTSPQTTGDLQKYINQLSDPDQRTRTRAAQALMRIGDAAVPALLRALRKGSYLTKIEAIYVLGSIKDRRAIQPMLHEFAKARPGSRIWLEISQAIQRMAPLAAPAFSRALQTASKSQQARLIDLLLRCGSYALPAIIRAFPTQEIAVQVKIIRLLGIRRRAKRLVAPLLLRAIQSPHSPVRAEAAKSLGYIQMQPRFAIPPLRRALRDRSSQVRYAAVRGLGAYKKDAAQFEFDLLASLRRPPLRNQLKVLDVLGYTSTRSERTTNAIAAFLNSPQRQLRFKALYVLSFFIKTQPAAISHIKQATQSQYPNTREKAQEILDRIKR